MSTTSKTQESPEQQAHQAPSTPGWKILVEAANAFASDTATRRHISVLHANLIARKDEHIPRVHIPEVSSAILAATESCPFQWPDCFAEFFHAQIGKEGLRALLEGSEFMIHDCGCPDSIGYHVVRTNPEQIAMDIESFLDLLFRVM
jgi:hypothetical protein